MGDAQAADPADGTTSADSRVPDLAFDGEAIERLAQLEKAFPGVGESLLRMVARQEAHDHRLEGLRLRESRVRDLVASVVSIAAGVIFSVVVSALSIEGALAFATYTSLGIATVASLGYFALRSRASRYQTQLEHARADLFRDLYAVIVRDDVVEKHPGRARRSDEP